MEGGRARFLDLSKDNYTQRSTPTQQGTAARRDRRPACPVADRGRGMAQPTCGAGVGRSFSCGEVTAHPPPGSPRYARSRRRSAVERWTTYLSYTTRKTGGNGDACYRIIDVLIFHSFCIEPAGELAHAVREHPHIGDRLLGGQGRPVFTLCGGAAPGCLLFCLLQSHPPFPWSPA